MKLLLITLYYFIVGLCNPNIYFYYDLLEYPLFLNSFKTKQNATKKMASSL